MSPLGLLGGFFLHLESFWINACLNIQLKSQSRLPARAHASTVRSGKGAVGNARLATLRRPTHGSAPLAVPLHAAGTTMKATLGASHTFEASVGEQCSADAHCSIFCRSSGRPSASFEAKHSGPQRNACPWASVARQASKEDGTGDKSSDSKPSRKTDGKTSHFLKVFKQVEKWGDVSFGSLKSSPEVRLAHKHFYK